MHFTTLIPFFRFPVNKSRTPPVPGRRTDEIVLAQLLISQPPPTAELARSGFFSTVMRTEDLVE